MSFNGLFERLWSRIPAAVARLGGLQTETENELSLPQQPAPLQTIVLTQQIHPSALETLLEQRRSTNQAAWSPPPLPGPLLSTVTVWSTREHVVNTRLQSDRQQPLSFTCDLPTGGSGLDASARPATHPQVLVTHDEVEPEVTWLVSSAPTRARKGRALATLLHSGSRKRIMFLWSPHGGGRSLALPFLTMGREEGGGHTQ